MSETYVKFGAKWCSPCHQIEPLLAAFAEKNPDITVMDVDVDEVDDISTWGVMSVPTVVVLNSNGAPIKRSIGLMPVFELLTK